MGYMVYKAFTWSIAVEQMGQYMLPKTFRKGMLLLSLAGMSLDFLCSNMLTGELVGKQVGIKKTKQITKHIFY